MSVGVLPYSSYHYRFDLGPEGQVKLGDLVALNRNLPSVLGVVVAILKEPAVKPSRYYAGYATGKYKVRWTTGKSTVVQGASLMKAEDIFKDAEDFMTKLSGAMATARAAQEEWKASQPGKNPQR